MTPQMELAARLNGQRDRAEQIQRLLERLSRLTAEQEAAWHRVRELQEMVGAGECQH